MSIIFNLNRGSNKRQLGSKKGSKARWEAPAVSQEAPVGTSTDSVAFIADSDAVSSTSAAGTRKLLCNSVCYLNCGLSSLLSLSLSIIVSITISAVYMTTYTRVSLNTNCLLLNARFQTMLLLILLLIISITIIIIIIIKYYYY